MSTDEVWINAADRLSEPSAYAEEMGFNCYCGKREWISPNEPPRSCSACGRQYRLRVLMEVLEPTS